MTAAYTCYNSAGLCLTRYCLHDSCASALLPASCRHTCGVKASSFADMFLLCFSYMQQLWSCQQPRMQRSSTQQCRIGILVMLRAREAFTTLSQSEHCVMAPTPKCRGHRSASVLSATKWLRHAFHDTQCCVHGCKCASVWLTFNVNKMSEDDVVQAACCIAVSSQLYVAACSTCDPLWVL